MATTAKAPAAAALPLAADLVIAGHRPADVVAFEVEVVDFFVSAADMLGLVPEYTPHLEAV